MCASFPCLHKALIKEDLPTFDLPIKANSGSFLAGLPVTFWELPENIALIIFIEQILCGKGTILCLYLYEAGHKIRLNENRKQYNSSGTAGKNKGFHRKQAGKKILGKGRN